MAIVSATKLNIQAALDLLNQGLCIGLPTETVYGLAANGLDANAAAKIFAIKQRPHFDPLILHVSDGYDLGEIAEIPPQARPLMERFWPGPLTLLASKKSVVPDLVTSGLETVAIRMPAHPVAREVISLFGKPLAAPSANRFGRISPTTAQHVEEELGDAVPLILDGGPCEVGIESTIVDVRTHPFRILRLGGISINQLEELSQNWQIVPHDLVQAPGMLDHHYAPRKPLYLCSTPFSECKPLPSTCSYLCWKEHPAATSPFIEILSPSGDTTHAAANLFRAMRSLDANESPFIVSEIPPNFGLGPAILDRLRKAASGWAQWKNGNWEIDPLNPSSTIMPTLKESNHA